MCRETQEGVSQAGEGSHSSTMLMRLVAGACALVAILVIAGWVFDVPALTTLGQPWTPMVATTAFGILLMAGVVLGSGALPETRLRTLTRVAGAAIAVIAATTLADFVSVWTRGVPLYPPAEPWRMAPNTAVAFLLVGIALLLMYRSRAHNAVTEFLVVLALFIGLNLLLSFFFGATLRSNLMGRVNMSPVTALCLTAIATTLLFQVPRGAVATVATAHGPGSQIARPLFALMVIVPVVFGALRLFAQHRGWLTLEYAVALTVLVSIAVAGFAIFWFAAQVNRYDARQRRELNSQMFLGRASDLLAQSMDLKATLAAVANLAVPALADWCSIALCKPDGSIENIAVGHQDPDKVAWAREYQRRFPPDPNGATGVAAVARTGKPEIHPEITEEVLAAAIRDPEQLAVIRALGMRSAMTLPLLANARTVGVLSLVTSESGRRFEENDLRIAQLLAERCASAIDRARLFEEVQSELAMRTKAEASLRALTAELEQRVAERTAELNVTNRELESFSYSVSHDLRTPLRALDGFSQALLDDYADRLDETGKDYLNRIRRGSQRMGDLIDALLDLSRVSRGEMQRERVDLSAIARDIVASLRQQAPAREIDADIAPAVTTTGDPRLLRALLQNLLGNAWKFTSKRPDARIAFGVAAKNGRQQPVFVVRDNGAGFDMSHASKLFGAFHRLHTTKEFEGTGVGLATVQRIVHRHGGEIWAESAPNEGARFYFTLSREEHTP